MHIAILSDSHSRYHTVAKALELLRQRGVDTVLHCGDITDTQTVRQFTEFTAHFVFGNCDIDRTALRYAIQEIGGLLYDEHGELEVDGTKLAWTHGDNHRLFRELEASGRFDFLFYGHSHIAKQHRTGNTLVVNPGALQRARVKTFVILNTATRELETVQVE